MRIMLTKFDVDHEVASLVGSVFWSCRTWVVVMHCITLNASTGFRACCQSFTMRHRIREELSPSRKPVSLCMLSPFKRTLTPDFLSRSISFNSFCRPVPRGSASAEDRRKSSLQEQAWPAAPRVQQIRSCQPCSLVCVRRPSLPQQAGYEGLLTALLSRLALLLVCSGSAGFS